MLPLRDESAPSSLSAVVRTWKVRVALQRPHRRAEGRSGPSALVTWSLFIGNFAVKSEKAQAQELKQTLYLETHFPDFFISARSGQYVQGGDHLTPTLFSAIYTIQRVLLWTQNWVSVYLLLFLKSFEQRGKRTNKEVLLQTHRIS